MSTQNLNESGPKAVQALLNSVAPHESPGDKLSQNSLRALSEKINQLLPEDSSQSSTVNEEGLPIIEVTEPSSSSTVEGIGSSLISDEDPFVPLSSLSLEQRKIRGEERDKILDLLEDEEREEQQRENEQFLHDHKKEIDKQKYRAETQMAQTKARKELQKKMGKALMQQMSETRQVAEKMNREAEETDLLTEKTRKGGSQKPRKKVSFANFTDSAPSSPADDWGDVSKARLRSPGLPQAIDSSSLPMKSQVIERIAAEDIQTPHSFGDSDDESDSESTHPSSSTCQEDSEFEDETYDSDEISHQREIATEYHRRREEITSEAIAALISNGPQDLHPEDQDSSLRPPAKPSISRFKASRLATSFNGSVASPMPPRSSSLVPESAPHILQEAIRTGKLDGSDQLVGEDSEEEEDPAVHENLARLTMEKDHAPPRSIPLPTIPPLAPKPKISKFKLSTMREPLPSENYTPTSSPARSSPKISTPRSTSPSSSSGTVISQEGIAPNRTSNQDPFLTVVESPSFPGPATIHHPIMGGNVVERTTKQVLQGQVSNSVHATSPDATPLSRPPNAPTVMSAAVTERPSRLTSSSNTTASLCTEASEGISPKKSSKFIVSRTGS